MNKRSLLIALMAFLALSLCVHAEGGSVQGRLLNGTAAPPRPLPAYSVQLYAESQGEKPLQEVKSDANGAFAFQGLDLNSQEHYVVGVEYADVAYYSDWIVLSPTTPDRLDLTSPSMRPLRAIATLSCNQCICW